MFDVIIVGGGPAGLSAALVLGRCRRKVLVCDAGNQRNKVSRHLHNFLTRENIAPAEFLRLGREDLSPYETVELRQTEVVEAGRTTDGFSLKLEDGESVVSRKLLLATGVVDELPKLQGFAEFYGRSVFHCPYCDGWELRDQPLAVYGRSENGMGLALELTLWSKDVVLCTDGPSGLSSEELQRLNKHHIVVREEPIALLEGTDGVLEKIVFADAGSIERRGMFFSTDQWQGSNLAKQLGCQFTEKGCVETGDYEATDIPGLYAAGDASRMVQFVIVAAAEGAQAAVAINKELMKADIE